MIKVGHAGLANSSMHAYLSFPSHYLPIRIKAFGDWIRHRRVELGLSCAAAAAASGLDLPGWKGLEQGWVPTGDEGLVRSIAGALEFSYDDVACAIAPLEVFFESTEG